MNLKSKTEESEVGSSGPKDCNTFFDKRTKAHYSTLKMFCASLEKQDPSYMHRYGLLAGIDYDYLSKEDSLINMFSFISGSIPDIKFQIMNE